MLHLGSDKFRVAPTPAPILGHSWGLPTYSEEMAIRDMHYFIIDSHMCHSLTYICNCTCMLYKTCLCLNQVSCWNKPVWEEYEMDFHVRVCYSRYLPCSTIGVGWWTKKNNKEAVQDICDLFVPCHSSLWWAVITHIIFRRQSAVIHLFVDISILHRSTFHMHHTVTRLCFIWV